MMSAIGWADGAVGIGVVPLVERRAAVELEDVVSILIHKDDDGGDGIRLRLVPVVLFSRRAGEEERGQKKFLPSPSGCFTFPVFVTKPICASEPPGHLKSSPPRPAGATQPSSMRRRFMKLQPPITSPALWSKESTLRCWLSALCASRMSLRARRFWLHCPGCTSSTSIFLYWARAGFSRPARLCARPRSAWISSREMWS
mmetsp:Transcript_3150/g.11402  ORF Transcript_3150/g.11402 Transcript_3150/m.11402 type:complete len:200 (+) Transcript_3150:1227-1826(+)